MEIQRFEKNVARWEDPASQTDRRVNPDEAPQFIERLASNYFDLAVEHFSAQSPSDVIVKYLRLAGEFAVLRFEQRRTPEKQTSRNFYDLNQKVLGLVACWCERPWRERLRTLPEWRYDWPRDVDHEFIPGRQEKPRKTEFRFFRAYAQLALDLLAHGKLAEDELNVLLADLEAGKGPKKEQEGEEALHSFRALRAIVGADEIAFNLALKALLALHQRRAKHGAYRTMSEGRICLNAMYLAQMAKERSFTVSATSEYLPLALAAALKN